MRTHASNCTWGCTDTLEESTLKADSRKKIPCHTKESNLRRQHAGLMLYQLSYIPTPIPTVLSIFTHRKQFLASDWSSSGCSNVAVLVTNKEWKKDGSQCFCHTTASFAQKSLTQVAGHKMTALTVMFSQFSNTGFNKQDQKPSQKLLCVIHFTRFTSTGPMRLLHFMYPFRKSFQLKS